VESVAIEEVDTPSIVSIARIGGRTPIGARGNINKNFIYSWVIFTIIYNGLQFFYGW
jgi:hypothetical protein